MRRGSVRLSVSMFVLTGGVALFAACGDAGGDDSYSFRGVSAGMSPEEFRAAATAAGTALECRPLARQVMVADSICATPDSAASMVRFSGVVNNGGARVPYIVVREGVTSTEALGRLTREWGAPTLTQAGAQRWQRGAWVADADTAEGVLTVLLTDTVTAAQMATAAAAERKRGTDTLPAQADFGAALDELQRDVPGRPKPILAEALDRRPVVIRCDPAQPPPELAHLTGSVTVYYVVDTLGRVERDRVQPVHATHAGLIPAAVASVRSCTLRPGRQGRAAVRTIIQQRVTFRPATTR